jgi:dCMP deaminase
MSFAKLAASRSTCLRRQVGAVAVKNNQIIATGYNGAASKQRHCLDIGCLRENIPSGTQHELCRAVHAEQNLICQAAKNGVSLEGSILYCTHQPCSICAKMIINAGISRTIYEEGYPDDTTKQLLKEKLYQLTGNHLHV